MFKNFHRLNNLNDNLIDFNENNDSHNNKDLSAGAKNYPPLPGSMPVGDVQTRSKTPPPNYQKDVRLKYRFICSKIFLCDD